MSIFNDLRIRFSRSGVSHPIGKFSADFPRFRGPEATKEILDRRAKQLGMSLAEYLRELAIVAAHGEEAVKSMYVRRIDVVARSGEETG